MQVKLGILATEKVQAFVLGTKKCIRLKSVVVSLICGIFSTQLRILMVVSAMKISEQDFGFDLEILGAVLWNEDKAVMPNDLINPHPWNSTNCTRIPFTTKLFKEVRSSCLTLSKLTFVKGVSSKEDWDSFCLAKYIFDSRRLEFGSWTYHDCYIFIVKVPLKLCSKTSFDKDQPR